ncbi:MAG TPA: rhodanese-like domain-containing protein [Eubacteriales bacterium]|nr:rhodanese-like domain-containing protein [Eubacteriales bacterium]
MKKLAVLAAVLFASVLFVSCAANMAQTASASDSDAEYHKITADQAKERIDSGDDLIILDVRTQEEYDAGHIENAVLLPNETISDTQPDLLPDLNQEILIYCRSGNRSAQAATKLVAMGYTAVYDFGGIIDWPYGIVAD